MDSIGWDDHRLSGAQYLGLPIYCQLKLTFIHSGHLLMNVMVLWQYAASLYFPISHCHMLPMDESSMKAWDQLFRLEVFEIMEYFHLRSEI